MDAPNQETFSFQAEVGRILDIVAHSLYSQKEVFLRELISNASDACDKLRYEALTRPELIEGDADFRIAIAPDSKAKTLTVSDNGIGMSRDDLIEQLGTIAKSGTQAFLQAAEAQKEKGGEVTLIGQFGVGFYAAFMVADRVEVVSKRAGEAQAVRWTSDGTGEFAVEPAERAERGTDVIVHLKKAEKEFLEPQRLEHIVRTYSDHIGVPVVLDPEKDGEEKTLNAASALWTRDKKDITDEQYKEFYHHVAHAFDEPWLTLHNRVEGVLSYTNLLFVPSVQPFDLFHPERKGHVKLYVKRVFITDDTEALLPPWLRFVRGIVDSEDLDLNVSREVLQLNPAVQKIRSGLTKKLLGELEKRAKKQDGGYDAFWETFGAVLKEGLYEDPEYRERILGLVRFKSTAADGWTSLSQYVERMKPGQEAIYYITGEDVEHAAKSPQLEGFRAKGVEVLFMTDPVDEFWLPSVGTFADKPFKSATRGGADLKNVGKDQSTDEDAAESKDDEKPSETTEGLDLLLAAFKTTLGTAVKDVRTTDRLTESACCLVADDGDLDIHLERLLKQHKQLDQAMPRILEINPEHGLVRRLAALAQDKTGQDPSLDEAAFLLLDQARIVEGESLPDPQAFAKRLAAMMEKGLA